MQPITWCRFAFFIFQHAQKKHVFIFFIILFRFFRHAPDELALCELSHTVNERKKNAFIRKKVFSLSPMNFCGETVMATSLHFGLPVLFSKRNKTREMKKNSGADIAKNYTYFFVSLQERKKNCIISIAKTDKTFNDTLSLFS